MASEQNKVLVVDDSETNRLMLSFMLQELLFSTDEVENGEQAVEHALEFDYAAIFMDLNMPIMNGLEATRVLRDLSYEPPIIACSAEDEPSKIKQLLESGFTDFIAKPVELEEVESILEKYKLRHSSKQSLDEQMLQEKLEQLRERFLINIPTIVSKINRVLKSNDFASLKRVAHKLKGSASQFGFDKVTKIGKDIELAISKNKVAIAIEKTHFLLAELEKISQKN